VRWYEHQAPLRHGFVDAIDSALYAIAEAPSRYPRWRGGQYRQLKVPRFPYLVIYVVRRTRVDVIAVAHTRRRPGYWLTDRER